MKINYIICLFLGIFIFHQSSLAQDRSECLACHEDRTLTGIVDGKNVSVFFNEVKFNKSVHAKLECIGCHSDLKDIEMPHNEDLEKVDCGLCHLEAKELYNIGLHGKAYARGDKLAPTCKDCHGYHEVKKRDDINSEISPLRIPYLCGKCHREGAPVQLQRNIHQSNILENYTESIHGEGLLKKGLAVTATCVSCHKAHDILPHTDSRSSIARRNIASTCANCHKQIEEVHRKIIRGELWEKEHHVLPACVDCHQPHKVRKVFYEQGMADKDCMSCHSQKGIKSAIDGRALYVDWDEIKLSRHQRVACSQCHTEVSPSKTRACATIKSKVDCSSCHAEVGNDFKLSIHGQYLERNDPNAPTCIECHGTHNVLGKRESKSPIFPINVPTLCAKCHQEGQKAAMRYTAKEHQVIKNYQESIHGKGLLKSGLVVTAMCTDCHSSHRILPAEDFNSSVHHNNISITCGRCHHGVEEKFESSVHSRSWHKEPKNLPTCRDCHSAHTIKRTDADAFKFEIMSKCGRCHEDIAKTYFDTYHGKVSRLGYLKTAKCYDCHGAHDIYPVSDYRSHLSRNNVVKTCQKCHPGANRRFAGYLTHATHHDPEKYPYLYWSFWGMTGLLIFTFVLGGLHTILWLPRAIQMRKLIRGKINQIDQIEKSSDNIEDPKNSENDKEGNNNGDTE